MAKLTKEERRKKLEEEVKKKKEKIKQIETEIQTDIGKIVMNEWGIDDEETAKEVITSLKDQAKELIKR